jgi:hypothetical protein
MMNVSEGVALVVGQSPSFFVVVDQASFTQPSAR